MMIVGSLLLAACRREGTPAHDGPGTDTVSATTTTASGTGQAPAGGEVRPRIVFLGTSLTAGLGVDPSQAYPALIQGMLDSAGYRYEAVNAGVSGETSAGALRRIGWVLRDPAAILVLETGANDGLRGLDTDSLAQNLQALLDTAATRQPPPRVLLVGMQALPNMGAAYARRFAAVYPAVAARRHVPLLPFLLEGVAGVDSLNQADGVHPTPSGQRRVANTVWRALVPLLARGGR